MNAPMVPVFFYGSYMNPDVLAEVGLVPARSDVARLDGYDIRIAPLANVVPQAGASVYGIVATATHAELDRLYAHARNVLGGTFHPHPVIVETLDGDTEPALCYINPDPPAGSAAPDYVDRIVGPARHYGFPDWYIERLESFRP